MKPTELALLIAVFFMAYKGTKKGVEIMSNIRGIRNHNWLNIRYNKANNWTGQTGSDDKNHSVFSDPVYSIRAGFKIFNTYKSRGLNTLEKVISTFAPNNENDTQNYIDYVASKSGVNPKAVLTANDYLKIMPHMIKMEIGSVPDSSLIVKAYALANG